MRMDIYYNLWGIQYQQKRKALQDRLGVPYPDRAIIDQEANTQLFTEHIRRITDALCDNQTNNIDSNTYLKTRSRWLQNLHSDYVTRLKSLEKDQIIQHSSQWISHSEQIINSTGNQELIYFAQDVFKIIRKNIAADLLSYTKPQPAGFHTCIYNKEHSNSLLRYLHKNINSRTGVPAFLYIQAAIEAKVIERPPYKIAVAEFPNIGKRANYDSYIGSSRNFRQHQETLKTITDEIKTLLK